MKAQVLEALHKLLFSSTGLTTATNNQIYYARAPVSSTFPQVVFFDVTDTKGYLVDYDSVTVQVSAWALDEITALNIHSLIGGLLSRFYGIVNIGDNAIDINYIELIDSGALPQQDQQLKGQFLRFVIRYRGTNIGG